MARRGDARTKSLVGREQWWIWRRPEVDVLSFHRGSTITWVIPRAGFYQYLEAFVRAGLGKRLMFGSDQMRWPEKIGDGIAAIEQAPFLTEQQRRDILYNNAVRFLRLDESSQWIAMGTCVEAVPPDIVMSRITD